MRLKRVRKSEGREDEVEVVAFCTALHPVLVGGLTLHCRDRGVAEDVAQETLVRVWERWATVQAMPSPEAWAWRVALNLTVSRFRRRAAEGRANARLAGRPAEVASSGPDLADGLAVRAAVGALPERQRAVLVLRFYADLPVAAVAEVLGCAPGTVKSLTHKAVNGLRSTLGDVVEEVVEHA